MTISRLYNFTPGEVIQSTQVDAEFNQLVAAVNTNGFDTVFAADYNGGVLSDVTIQAALAVIGGSSKTLYLKTGTWSISSNLSIPGNVQLEFSKGASLSISTGVTVTISGPIQTSLQHIFSLTGTGIVVLANTSTEEIPVEWLGAKVDGVISDSTAINNAIKIANASSVKRVRLGYGTSYSVSSINIMPGVILNGWGIDKSIIDFKDNTSSKVIATTSAGVLPSTTDLSAVWLNNLNKGDTTNTLTSSLVAGDMIAYKTTVMFDTYWNAVPAHTTNHNEHFKVKSNSGTVLTFNEPAAFNYLVADKVSALAWTPIAGVEVRDMTIRRNTNVAPETYALHLQYCDSPVVENVKTQNTSYSGVTIDKTYNAYLRNIHTFGDPDKIVSNTGIRIINGSKHTNIEGFYGSFHRHGIDAGSNGTGIPMYASLTNFSIDNTLTDCISLKTHGTSAFFKYSNGTVDLGIDVAGYGHVVSNVTSTGGGLQIYEGGYGLIFDKVNIENCTLFYSNDTVINSQFKNVKLNFHNGYAKNTLNSFSLGNTFENFSLINQKIAVATNNANADTYCTLGFIGLNLHDNDVAKNVYLYGFPSGLYISGHNAMVDNAYIFNCGWDSALITYESALGIANLKNNNTINNVLIAFDQVALTNTGHAFRMGQGGNAGTYNTINNVRYSSYHGAGQDFAGAIQLTNGTYNTITNFKLTAGTSSISGAGGTGNYLRNNTIPIGANGGTSGVMADGATITHGLTGTPIKATVTASVANEFASITAISAMTLTVAIKKHDGTPGTNQIIYWYAEL